MEMDPCSFYFLFFFKKKEEPVLGSSFSKFLFRNTSNARSNSHWPSFGVRQSIAHSVLLDGAAQKLAPTFNQVASCRLCPTPSFSAGRTHAQPLWRPFIRSIFLIRLLNSGRRLRP